MVSPPNTLCDNHVDSSNLYSFSPGAVKKPHLPDLGKWVVSNVDGSNLRLLGFSPFRSRRFQQRGRGGPDRTLRRGCR